MSIEHSHSPWAYRIAVSKDLDWLRGLIFVGLGLSLAGIGLPRGEFIFLGGAFLTSFFIAPCYRKNYGLAYPKTSRVLLSIIGVCGTYFLIFGTIYLDTHFPMMFLWTPLILAPILLAGFWAGQRHVGLTPWHWAACLTLFASAFLPLLGWPLGPEIGPLFVGAVLIAIGIVDHLRLTSALAESTEA